MKRLATVIWIVIAACNIQAQQVYKMIPEQSTMIVTGTSSLHNWEVKAEKIDCKIIVKNTNPSRVIDMVNLTVWSSDLVSDNSIMDKKTQEALKSDKYPEIIFNLNSNEKPVISNNNFGGTVTGELSLAGVVRNISVPFTGELKGDHLYINGSEKIDMSEFGIQPPTALLGTLKTGKEVTIIFSLNFKLENGT